MKRLILALCVLFALAATAHAQYPCYGCQQPHQWQYVPVGPPQRYARYQVLQSTWSLFPWIERYRKSEVIIPVAPPLQPRSPAHIPKHHSTHRSVYHYFE
jgi:hypothetical protein